MQQMCRYKSQKCKSQGKEFSAFGIESYGGLGKGAQKVLELIGLEGLAGGSPNRMSGRSFRAWLSVDWQRSNARILREWLLSHCDGFARNCSCTFV